MYIYFIRPAVAVLGRLLFCARFVIMYLFDVLQIHPVNELGGGGVVSTAALLCPEVQGQLLIFLAPIRVGLTICPSTTMQGSLDCGHHDTRTGNDDSGSRLT